jgi:arginine:pyruvate transaminase
MFVMLSVDGLGLDGEAFAFRLLDEEHVAVMPGAPPSATPPPAWCG